MLSPDVGIYCIAQACSLSETSTRDVVFLNVLHYSGLTIPPENGVVEY